ncbi:MAG: MFS transporter [Sphingobium sp.]
MHGHDQTRAADDTSDAAPRGSYGVLALFLLIHFFLNIDRAILGVVIEPIKHEFHLTDSDVGLLQLAFATFFVLGGIPLGQWVDRGTRRIVLSCCLGLFSAMTAAASLTTTYAQLLISRVLVGAGEAGGGPAMLSMISDIYAPARRARAIAIYYLAGPIAFIATFMIGGHMTAAFGWRSVFIAAGVPGIFLALVTLAALREPSRGAFEAPATSRPGVLATLRFIFSQPALRNVLAAGLFFNVMTSATVTWAVSVLIRSHGLALQQAGTAMALSYGAIGAIGILIGGWAADLLATRDIRWRAWTLVIAGLAACPALLLFVLAPSAPLAILGLSLWSITAGANFAPVMGLIHSLTVPRMRGTASAIYYMIGHFAGMGGGPLLVGFASDLLASAHQADSLRYGLALLSPLYLWMAWHFLRASRTLAVDVARAHNAGG